MAPLRKSVILQPLPNSGEGVLLLAFLKRLQESYIGWLGMKGVVEEEGPFGVAPEVD